MKKLVHNLVTVGLVGALALFVSGCEGKYTGGGVIDSTIDPAAKASFGFNMQAIDTDGDCEDWGPAGLLCNLADEAKGQLQYKDHGTDEEDYAKGMSIHGVVTDGAVTFDLQDTKIVGKIEGTYKPQPKGESGTFTVYVFDEGEPGASEEDSFSISLSGGAYDGYSNSGLLNNGNIQYHEPEED